MILILPLLTTMALFMIAEIDIPGEGVIHVVPDNLVLRADLSRQNKTETKPGILCAGFLFIGLLNRGFTVDPENNGLWSYLSSAFLVTPFTHRITDFTFKHIFR